MNDLNYESNRKYDNGFTKKVIDEIKIAKHSILFSIYITNASMISSIYGQDFLSDIFKNLLEKIIDNSQEKIIYNYNIDGYIEIFINCNINKISDKALKIHNIIKLFGSESTATPYHLMSIISSIIIPDEAHDIIDAMNKTHNIIKNNQFNTGNFYYPYSNIEIEKLFSRKKFILGHSLKNAIINKRLRLAFQPIINSKTGKVEHYESLLRIVSDEGKIISVGPFIPIAEEMGFIDLIDNIILDMVIEELRNNKEINLAFNLSACAIYDQSWFKKFKKLVNDASLSSRLTVEITETALQKDLKQSANFILAIQDIGCQVALDDFGAGYTSFRQLKELPVDIIKIDGSFIRDISDNNNNLLFVKALIEMTKNFGFKSIAEFVENGEIAKALINLNVDYMQGNYFCPAINYRIWKRDDI